jgi:hypothetical protein
VSEKQDTHIFVADPTTSTPPWRLPHKKQFYINPHAGRGTTKDENFDQLATERVVKTQYRNMLI